MKQIIKKYYDSRLNISYYPSGKIMAKRIRINDKIYGLEIWYDCDGKIDKQKYYL